MSADVEDDFNTFMDDLMSTFGFEFTDEFPPIQSELLLLDKSTSVSSLKFFEQTNLSIYNDMLKIEKNLKMRESDVPQDELKELEQHEESEEINDDNLNDKDFEAKYKDIATNNTVISLNVFLNSYKATHKTKNRIKKLRRTIYQRKYALNYRRRSKCLKNETES